MASFYHLFVPCASSFEWKRASELPGVLIYSAGFLGLSPEVIARSWMVTASSCGATTPGDPHAKAPSVTLSETNALSNRGSFKFDIGSQRKHPVFGMGFRAL